MRTLVPGIARSGSCLATASGTSLGVRLTQWLEHLAHISVSSLPPKLLCRKIGGPNANTVQRKHNGYADCALLFKHKHGIQICRPWWFVFESSMKTGSKSLWDDTRGLFIYFPWKESYDTKSDRHASWSALPIHKKEKETLKTWVLKSVCRQIEWKNKLNYSHDGFLKNKSQQSKMISFCRGPDRQKEGLFGSFQFHHVFILFY